MLTRIKRILSWARKPVEDELFRPPFFTKSRITPYLRGLIQAVQPFTMTSPQRIAALAHAVEYLSLNSIPGAFVECGVWRGGSMMAAALTLQHLQARSRDLYLFDTFQGMTIPGAMDRDLQGQSALDLLQEEGVAGDGVRAVAGLEEVRANLARTEYSAAHLHFIGGDVVQTLPAKAPAAIALLRLDTDWYESTYHELIHLYPRLVPGGILIVDDYGHWQGARQAVDQYLRKQGIASPLHPIDYTGRLLIKEAA